MATEFVEAANAGLPWSDVEGYMCGPPVMIAAATAKFIKLGVDLHSIHYDKFTDSSHGAK